MNVIVSAMLAPSGTPAALLRHWQQGSFEMVVSPHLLAELGRVLSYPKIRSRLSAEQAAAVIQLLSAQASLVDDPPFGTILEATDPGDDYLLALAIVQRAYLVTGDHHLLDLDPTLPIEPPAAFLARLDAVA